MRFPLNLVRELESRICELNEAKENKERDRIVEISNCNAMEAGNSAIRCIEFADHRYSLK